MKLLVTTTEQAARDIEAKADAWLRADVARYCAGQWSDIYVSADGMQYGIAFENRLIPAFTSDELGTTVTGSGDSQVTSYANIIDATLATDDAPGWSVVPPPAPEDQP